MGRFILVGWAKAEFSGGCRGPIASYHDNDHGQKLAFYKALPTLRHIVLIDQDSVRVEHYWRAEESWEVEMPLSLDTQLFLDAIKFEVTLAPIYFEAF